MLLLVLLLPIMILVCCIQVLVMGRPLFFVQERAGEGGRVFKLYKFRSMENGEGVVGDEKEDARRTNRWGIFIRRTSLDELPQLINVLKGEMSLVGPRPLLCESVFGEKGQRKRLLVKPGITGLAQVRGRKLLSSEKRLESDLWYIEHMSLWLDLKIVIRTVVVVLSCKGS